MTRGHCGPAWDFDAEVWRTFGARGVGGRHTGLTPGAWDGRRVAAWESRAGMRRDVYLGSLAGAVSDRLKILARCPFELVVRYAAVLKDARDYPIWDLRKPLEQMLGADPCVAETR